MYGNVKNQFTSYSYHKIDRELWERKKKEETIDTQMFFGILQ